MSTALSQNWKCYKSEIRIQIFTLIIYVRCHNNINNKFIFFFEHFILLRHEEIEFGIYYIREWCLWEIPLIWNFVDNISYAECQAHAKSNQVMWCLNWPVLTDCFVPGETGHNPSQIEAEELIKYISTKTIVNIAHTNPWWMTGDH